MIGFSPDNFWNSSIFEIVLAVKGFSEFNGADTKKPMSKDDLDSLMERYPDN